jgi:hypothetical protein
MERERDPLKFHSPPWQPDSDIDILKQPSEVQRCHVSTGDLGVPQFEFDFNH